jgi:hypothetical protein
MKNVSIPLAGNITKKAKLYFNDPSLAFSKSWGQYVN